MKNKKLKAYQRGHNAEKLAALYLMIKGYQILARRYKTPMGEIDLVAKRGKTLAMIEVKRRGDEKTALESVTLRNQARVAQAANHFLAANPRYNGLNVRFDVIVTGRPFYWRHLDNAWQGRT